jgi:hypothetical protein
VVPQVESLEDRALLSFLPSVHYSLGGDAGPPLVGDFNSDGIPDILSTGFRARLLFGNGDGSFQDAVAFDAGIRPNQIGDFNGDGALDLAGPARDAVAVWLGNGDGSFQPALHSALPLGPGEMAAADLNADGLLDIISAPVFGYDGSPFLRVLLGNGDGTFQTAIHHFPGQQLGKPVVADFNHDGILDVAGTFYKPTILFPHLQTGYYVSVWLGRGDGSLDGPLDRWVDDQPGAVTAGDFNNDGILDLAIPHRGGQYGFPQFATSRVSMLLGNGDGTFQEPLTHWLFPDARPLSIVAADFNRDGHLDLVLANWEFGYDEGTPVTILLGNGDGTFQSPQSFAAHRGRQFLAVADLNLDGLPDLVVYNSYSSDLSVLLNAGDW